MTKTPVKIGRPRAKIDPDAVLALARIHCTQAEIAAVLGCSVDTLARRFADTIKKGQDEGKASLRRMQYKAASDGNPTMLIWLGKQLLGQHEPTQEFRDLSGMTDADLEVLAAGRAPK